MSETLTKEMSEYQNAVVRLAAKAPEYAAAFPTVEAIAAVPRTKRASADRREQSAETDTPLRDSEASSNRVRVPGMGSLLLRGKTWWACYYVNGKEHRESARQPDEGFRDGSFADAKRLLRKRVGEIEGDQYVAPDAKRLTFEVLRDDALADYTRRGLRSHATAVCRFENLARVFAGQRVPQITTARLLAYQDFRRGEGAANGTINRELIALHRAFVLARKAKKLKVAMIPEFPDRLEESAPRQGFLEHGLFVAVSNALIADEATDHADVFEAAYFSGWRRREIHSLPWRMVDLAANVLRLDPDFSKTKKGRVVPIPAPLRVVLERRFAKRRLDCPLVFHVNGRPMGDWRKTWAKAVIAAGCFRIIKGKDGEERKVPSLVLHDCRRTAVRNLVRAGVPDRVAMTFTGHRTRSVFDRYNIVSERDLHDAGDKLAAYVASLDSRPPVVSLAAGRASATR
jgi:integrase